MTETWVWRGLWPKLYASALGLLKQLEVYQRVD